MTDSGWSRAAQWISAFHYADFRVLWASTVSNQLGLGMQQVLLGWLVFEITDSGGMVGVIFAARSAPNLLVGFVAGSITDRTDRRVLMRITVAGMVLCAASVALLLYFDRLAVWQLILAAVALGAFQSGYMTARQAYIYDVVGLEGAVNGIALISMAQRAGGLAGALAGGAVFQWWGPAASFFLMSAGYLVGGAAMYWLKEAGQSVPAIRESMTENLANFLRALKTNRVLLILLATTASAEMFGFSHQVAMPILVKDVLNMGAASLGLLTAFRFVGGAIGTLVAAVAGRPGRQGPILVASLVLFGAGEAVLSQAPGYWTVLAMVVFIAVAAAVTDILHHALLQTNVPNEQRGRAMGIWIVGLGFAPAGQLEIGYLAGGAGPRVALLVNGAVLTVMSLGMGLLLPRLRRL